MTATPPARGPHRAVPFFLAMIFAVGCITADGVIRPDGGATLTLVFPTPATADNDKAARALVTTPEVTLESLAITDAVAGERGPRRATAKLVAKQATALAGLPLLRVFGTTIVHDRRPDGSGSLRVTLPNPTPKKKDDPEAVEMMKHQATVRLRVPGPVLETSASEKDGVVTWSFAAGEWTVGKTLDLSVAYGPPADAPKPATGDSRDGDAS